VYAVRFVQNMPIAEEIASDVMYKIWQNRHQGYQIETFREYLYTATRNTALNYLKQQQTRKKFSDEWAEQLRDELIEETPLDAIISEEEQAKLNNMMDALPEQCRKAFVMSRIEEMSYDEIAAQMDISVNTVKYDIKTALQKLRVEMGNLFMWMILFLSFFWIFFHTHLSFFHFQLY
jgi:RNA polymerase sigma-70 factor (ECF subfamily)